MDYKVIWDDEAIAELAQAVRHIAPQNPVAARRTGATIRTPRDPNEISDAESSQREFTSTDTFGGHGLDVGF